MTSLCKANSPAIPLALPSGATGVLKSPEEVVVVGGTECIVHVCVCEYVCKMCVTGYECGCLCPTGSVDSPVLPAPPCPPPAAEGVDEREATVGLTFNN